MPHVEQGKEIILHTFGGDLFEGWRIHDAIRMSGLNPSIGVVGVCASAAVQILLATDNRWMSQNSRVLIHNPWTFEAGDDDVMRSTANELEKDKLKLAGFYASISGKSTEEILAIMKEERFMHSDEAMAMNFVQSIKANVELKTEDNPMDKKQFEESMAEVKNMFASIMNLVKPKNLTVQDVNGNELDFGESVQTPEQIAVGVTATVGGNPANGDYAMPDGTVYVFENGTLTEIKAPESDEEMEALKSENETLKAENEALKTENNSVKEEYNKFKNDAATKISEAMAKYNNLVSQYQTLNIAPAKPAEGKEGKEIRKAFKKKDV